jgi:hypothetical protein
MGSFKRLFKDDSICGLVEACLLETFSDLKCWKVSSGPITGAEVAEYRLGSCHLRVTHSTDEDTYLVEIRTWPKPEHPEDQVDPGLVFWPLEALADGSCPAYEEGMNLSAQIKLLHAVAYEILVAHDPAEILREQYERTKTTE